MDKKLLHVQKNTYECPISMWKSAQHQLYNTNVHIEMQKIAMQIEAAVRFHF